MALGGPNSRSRTTHARLTGLNDWHFDRVIGHLRATLRELGTAEPDIAAAGAPGTKR
jgi:methyl-accepting chemotaxis protein